MWKDGAHFHDERSVFGSAVSLPDAIPEMAVFTAVCVLSLRGGVACCYTQQVTPQMSSP